MSIVCHAEMVKRHPPLALKYIKQRLNVNVSTGRCIWEDPSKYHALLIGREAGGARESRGGKFYWIIKIDGIKYFRSNIVYAVKTGFWPNLLIDHKNSDSLDDRGCNLRLATFAQNAHHRIIGNTHRDIPMGVKQQGSKWQARIRVNKQLIHLGTFPTVSAARRTYLIARRMYFGEFA